MIDITKLYKEVDGKIGPHSVTFRVTPAQPHHLHDMSDAFAIALAITQAAKPADGGEPKPATRKQAEDQAVLHSKLACASVTGFRTSPDEPWQRITLVRNEIQHKPKNNKIWVGFLTSRTRALIFAHAAADCVAEAVEVLRARFPVTEGDGDNPQNVKTLQDPTLPAAGDAPEQS